MADVLYYNINTDIIQHFFTDSVSMIWKKNISNILKLKIILVVKESKYEYIFNIHQTVFKPCL